MRTLAVVLAAAVVSGCGSAMTKAVNKSDPDAVEAVLSTGADPNQYFASECEFGGCIKGYTPLMWATLGGKVKVMEVLLRRGADVDLPCRNQRWLGWTALCFAAEHSRPRNIQAARLLLQHGANPRASCGGDGTPLEFAQRAGGQEMVRLLKNPGAHAAPEVSLDGHLAAIEAHEKRGDTLREQNRTEQALEAYTDALSAVPPGGGTQPRIIALRDKTVRFCAGLSSRPAVSEKARANGARGQAFIKLAKGPEDYNAAASALAQAISAAPCWADAYYNLALVAEKLGHFDTAIRALNWNLALEPDSPDAGAVRQKLAEVEVAKEQSSRSYGGDADPAPRPSRRPRPSSIESLIGQP
ncbi:MAG: ankyrin repeat domain-containing protein [Elusimicrobia bacterium]|nr:ankyrin repeat domain-containing protein [Elusimicrobiota bacterium]